MKMQEEMKGFLLTKVDLDSVYRLEKWFLSPFLQGSSWDSLLLVSSLSIQNQMRNVPQFSPQSGMA